MPRVDGDATRPHGELSDWAAKLGVTPRPSLTALQRPQPAPDASHPATLRSWVRFDAAGACIERSQLSVQGAVLAVTRGPLEGPDDLRRI